MSTLLDLAYKSQYDADAGLSRNDCGPACLAMIINALGTPVTTDAVFRRTGAQSEAYITMAQLMRAGESYGAPLEYRRGWGLGELHAMLDLGRPLVALVHYGAFSQLQPGVSTQSQFTGPHFLLVTGYDENMVVVHDPLWTGERRSEGAFRRWENDVWLAAWGRCHEDHDAAGQPNPDFAALISVRPVTGAARTQVPADVVRRIRAKCAYLGVPQPDLAQPATLNGYAASLGEWGLRREARRVTATDTLWRLAKAYYGDGNKMDVIRFYNGLEPTDVIYNGQVLLIPEPTLPGVVPEDRLPTGVTSAAAERGPRW
jgi:hypothetical protein